MAILFVVSSDTQQTCRYSHVHLSACLSVRSLSDCKVLTELKIL